MDNLDCELNNFFPFALSTGLSECDTEIRNVKRLYYYALRRLDRNKPGKANKSFSDYMEEVNIEEIMDSDFRELIYQRDVQRIFDELDNFFKKIKENSITYYKSAAIELINYVAYIINKNNVINSISKCKAYSRIIGSKDLREIEHIVKNSIRDIYIHLESAVEEGETGELDQRIIDYMKINFSKNLTLEEVAAKFYLSPGHIIRVLKKTSGKTFIDLLTEIRIKNAEVLLKNPRYKTYEVANAVGFKDPKYFSQVFKKLTGKTPSEYK